MTAPSVNEKLGIVYTFYSFKGGVGRTMALANVAALLAKWGYSVLAVDWDLEAPGLEQFFSKLSPDIHRLRKEKPGIVDLMHAGANGSRLRWQDCLLDININGGNGRLSVLSAGRNDDKYSIGMQSLNFPELFDKHGLGSYIETLRNEWISEFDFVLIDSRTGVTDIGGICTVHLADVLVLLFTANDSSSDGALEIVERARKAQEHFPLDRRRLLAVPVPARDESRTEYERATQWKNRFAEQFGELYRDWLPSGKTPHDAIELLRIPYVPYWSFGEQLPAIEEGTSDPASLGHAYQILARILATRLDWFKALEGETLAPPPAPGRRRPDDEWLVRHRKAALAGLATAEKTGFMEVCHFSRDIAIDKSQHELLAAARQAQVHTFGWPIGLVLDNREDARPRPTDDGIVANVNAQMPTPFGRSDLFDYWALSKSGDFFTLSSLPEDDQEPSHSQPVIHFDTRIRRATEALLHCANLYKALGVDPNAHVEMVVRYGGLEGRTLGSASPGRRLVRARTTIEHEVSAAVVFRLGAVESLIVQTVKKLCEPLFVVFDFATILDDVYQQIVTDFVNGKVS
jgi:MinD-like ATPase involved in chromosome partitioning or flagellar assembly